MASIADPVAAHAPYDAAIANPEAGVTQRDRAGRHRAADIAWMLLAASGIATGVYLRVTQLSTQILLDDEWHAIHKLLHSDVKGILTSFGVADYSIPLTLYYRFLADHGGLSEWGMHLPLLVAGIALLVVAPLLMRRDVAPPVRATWIALLAISPLLVYLTRTARPYALTCLLAFVAVVAFRNWWRRAPHATAWASLYVIAIALAGWLHLITLPFTLLPFAYYAIVAALSQREQSGRRAILRLLCLGAAVGVLLAVALGPPIVASTAQLTGKAGADSVTLDSAYRTALLMGGFASPWALAIELALFVAGAIGFARRDGDFVAYIAVLCIGTAIVIVVARPAWIQHPLVFARYMLPALPFALLFVAEGVVAVAARVRRPIVGPVAVALAALLLFRIGPMPGYLYFPNQFMEHARFQFDYDDAHNPYVLEIPREPIPAFYRQLAKRRPGSVTLIEAPWRLESNFIPFPWYQAVHRQFIKIGLVTPICGVRDFGEYPPGTTGLRFRNFVHLTDVLAGKNAGADYLVMHRKAWKTPPDADVDWPDVDACLPAIAAKLGAPTYRDESIVVFDLKAHR